MPTMRIMRPPAGMKEWFVKMEEEGHALLDESGGMATRTRRYRITFALTLTLILAAMWAGLVLLVDIDLAGKVITTLVTSIGIVFVWFMAMNPHKAWSVTYGSRLKK